MSEVLIKNIGSIFTGEMEDPIMEGPLSVIIRDGKISAIQKGDCSWAGKAIDASLATLAPGLIDSHTHPVFGDFTPRQNMIGFIDSSLHGGVTSMISAGEVHLPGRPKDPKSAKALALLAKRCFENARPSGVKVHAGALILEKGLKEGDFKELSEDGVRLVGEIGLGSVKTASEAKEMVLWAKKYGMKVLMHVGGTSIPGSSTVTCEDVLEADPTVACHLNGGPTCIPPREAFKVIDKSSCVIELVHCGNMLAAFEIGRYLKETGRLSRLILGNDAPSGTGVIPLGIWRMIAFLSGMCEIPAETALCLATGNTKKAHGLEEGVIRVGAPADLQLIDAPMGSEGRNAKEAIEKGDIPGIGMVMIDGVVNAQISRNTPPPARKPIF